MVSLKRCVPQQLLSLVKSIPILYSVLFAIKNPSRLIEMGIDGFSTTVFCYGQTGSGKTHTLTGPPYLVSTDLLEQIATHHLGENTD